MIPCLRVKYNRIAIIRESISALEERIEKLSVLGEIESEPFQFSAEKTRIEGLRKEIEGILLKFDLQLHWT